LLGDCKLLNDKINRWQLAAVDGPLFQQVNERLDHLANALYHDYEPTIGPFPEYWRRLESWVENVGSEDDQKLLFRLAAELFFVGDKELDNLYRVAFNANVCHWLIDQLRLELDDPQLESSVGQALDRTWFCPVTDSMRINAFYHLNHISGRDYRPDWRSLAKFGDPTRVDAFLRQKIDRVVLLEDFVGSGSQIEPVVSFLCGLPKPPPTLLIPLIICPAGAAAAAQWSVENPALTVSPVIRLEPHDFLGQHVAANEPPNFPLFRRLVQDTFALVLNGADPIATKTYTAFGFRHTGSLVVLATNCPDNTLPLVHHRSDTWQPLFPRASRI
jgi:hypothetical protein